jgi:hypothetical protein
MPGAKRRKPDSSQSERKASKKGALLKETPKSIPPPVFSEEVMTAS